MENSEEIAVVVPTEVAPSNQLLAFIQAAITDERSDVAKMTQAVDLYERLLRHDAETAFNQAMARLAPKLPRIQKNGTIDMGAKGSIPFAKWEDIDRIIRPLLTEEGLSLSFGSEPVDKGVIMICTLSHVLGHCRTSKMQLPADEGPGRNHLQAMGSARQYGKRYLAVDLLNLVCVGIDDDANSVGQVTEAELIAVTKIYKACDMNDTEVEGFLTFMGITALSEIRRHDYEKAMNMLRAKFSQKSKERRNANPA